MAKKKTESKKLTSASAKKKPAAKKQVVSIPKKTATKSTAKSIVPKAKSTRKKLEITPTQLLVNAAIEGIEEVKGQNITVLDLRKITSRVCDYYIICQAESKTQVAAIADSVEVTVKKQTKEIPYHIEGTQNAEWILIDYVNVVVHVFQTEARYFYNLEALWADAEVTKIERSFK